MPNTEKKPPWLKKRVSSGHSYGKVLNLLRKCRLHTVCESAHCPNLGEKPDIEKGWISNKTSAGVYQFEYLLADNYRARGNFWLRPDFAKFSGDYLAEMLLH